MSKAFATFWLSVSLVLGGAVYVSYAHASTPDRATAIAHHLKARHHVLARLHAKRVHARDLYRASLVRAWTPIAICENGGWNPPKGPRFPNSLGITAANWYGNGGGTDLRRFVQAKVAYRIQNPPPTHCPW